MKPEWKDAPKSSQWLAMDMDGQWIFFNERPYIDAEEDEQIWMGGSGHHSTANYGGSKDWQNSLEKRP